MKISHALTAAAYLLPGALAWGSFGHVTVGYLASQLVSLDTETYFQTLMHNQTDSYIAGIATWADEIRNTDWGRWTETFHFIDAKDTPPVSCNIDMARDCKASGCVVGAVANYTQILVDFRRASTERAIAFRFLVHFIGDLHQPLHNEDVKRGGNDIFVKFDGTKINLHKVWDSKILDAMQGGIHQGYPQAKEWAATLAQEIRSGKFRAASGAWAAAVSLDEPAAMALSWAREGNAYICTDVLPQGPIKIVDQELGEATSYYEAATGVIEIQIARAGFRLAALLDRIASASREVGNSDIDEL